MIVRIALSLLAAVFLSGCFVIDELNSGNAEIEKYSVGWREKKKEKELAAKHKAENAGPSIGSRVVTSWDDAKNTANGWWQDALEEEAPRRDSTDIAVSCEIGGQIQFLRKSDCALRGGRTKERRSSP